MSRHVLPLLSALACAGPRGGAGPAPEPVAAGRARVVSLPETLPPGLSGLAWLPDGRLLAVSERAGQVVLLDPTGVSAPEVRPVSGVPDGLDLEAVAHLGGDRVALGTESHDPGRSVDVVLLGTIGPGGVAVSQAIDLAWAPFGIRPSPNRGVEAVCMAGGTLVAVAEEVGSASGRRFAPVWLRDLSGGPVQTARLLLSSEEGKVSGLSCRPGPDHEVVLTAIERHYATRRLVSWVLPIDGTEPVAPERVLDLQGAMGERSLNPEGLALDPAGGAWIVSDNDHGGVSGPAMLVHLPPGGDRSSGQTPGP